jgi:Fur family peroxide stress response transcriptional regulator
MKRKQRNTPQRSEILKYLEGNKNHPSAYEVYYAVKKRMPNVSFATVYNNLKKMTDNKEIMEINFGDKKRFDPDTSFHDHFACVKCSRVFDIPKVMKNVSYKNFKILSHMTYITGVCEDCIKKGG